MGKRSGRGRWLKWLSAAAVGIGMAISVGPAGAGIVYWAELGTGIFAKESTALSGDPTDTILSGINPKDVAVDLPSDTLFWTDPTAGTIKMALLADPVNTIGDLVTGESGLDALAWDGANSQVFWTVGNAIRAMAVDDLAPHDVLTGLSGLGDIEVRGSNLFWTQNGTIQRSDLAGGSVSTVLDSSSGKSAGWGLALDSTYAYFDSASDGKIFRADANATNSLDANAVASYGSFWTPSGMTVDEQNGKFFWSNTYSSNIAIENSPLPPDGSFTVWSNTVGTPWGMTYANPIPEPAHTTLFLLGSGLILFAGRRSLRRRRCRG